jgi:hypothetical protein
MEKRLARIISVVFHPLLIPTYIIAVLINMRAFFALMIPDEAKWKIILLVFLTSAIFPMIALYGMYRLRLISNLMMEKREDRLYPYLAATLFFFLSFYMIRQINISPVYYYSLLGAALLALVTLMINVFWKVSAHTVSMGGVLGILTGLHLVLHIDLSWLIFATVFLGGIVGYARLRAGTHTDAQVYAGYLIGFLGTYLLIMYY